MAPGVWNPHGPRGVESAWPPGCGVRIAPGLPSAGRRCNVPMQDGHDTFGAQQEDEHNDHSPHQDTEEGFALV